MTIQNSFGTMVLFPTTQLVFFGMFLVVTVTKSCPHCEEIHSRSSQSSEIQETRPNIFRCSDVCQCPSLPPRCQDGVPLVLDGCGCCPVCARQQGDVCNVLQVCDSARKLHCTYADLSSTSGICRVRRGQSCRVGKATYQDGETFKTDCRTQCTCQNGTYGCVSLCPQESVIPSDRCQHPRLVEIHGSCCREWLCDSNLVEDRQLHCQPYTSKWSSCSTTCGIGLSFRISNDNPECQLKNETRICTLRPCPEKDQPWPEQGHHVRKNHQCRATVHSPHPVRLRDGNNCSSVSLHQLRYCGMCKCCHPTLTTTKKIPFRCVDEDGTQLILQKDVLWIIKCNCNADTCR